MAIPFPHAVQDGIGTIFGRVEENNGFEIRSEGLTHSILIHIRLPIK
jgi:hypothetical protein